MNLVTLLTDFGSRDGYAAAVKGSILTVNPLAVISDITHDVAPFDIEGAAFVLKTSCVFFPKGSIHVAVVDPGVGTSRKAMAVKAGGHYFVGPDNGIFTDILREAPVWDAVEIVNPGYMRTTVSSTFHARDIFGPVASHLALGALLADLGPALARPVTFQRPQPVVTEGRIEGEIIYVDHFGNCISNIRRDHLKRLDCSHAVVKAGPCACRGISDSYAQLPSGSPAAVISSSGHLEIAVNAGNLHESCGVTRGTVVTVDG